MKMDGINIYVLEKNIMSNDTGDKLVSRANSKKYSDNYDRIFRKKLEWEDEIKQEEDDKILKRKGKDEKSNI